MDQVRNIARKLKVSNNSIELYESLRALKLLEFRFLSVRILLNE